jgi:LysR family hydrogen peroxide-inducible transcriptional activator
VKTYNFTLRQIQYVVAVADMLSFRRAAERCNVSQPSLSAQIAEMEAALGVALFERDRRGVFLTSAGHELVGRARRMLVEADDFTEAANRFVDPLGGTLRIGVIPTIGPYLLPHIVPVLRQVYPSLMIIWIEEKTEALVRAVSHGDLDAALLALEANVGDLEHHAIAIDPFVLATPPGHQLGRHALPVTRSQLRGERILLLDDGHCFRDQVLEYCSSGKVEELGFRATSLPTLAQMVSSGAGITLLPSIAIPTEARRSQLSIRPFSRPAPFRTIVLGWRRRSTLADTLHQIAQRLRLTLEKHEKLQSDAGNRTGKAARPRKTKEAAARRR